MSRLAPSFALLLAGWLAAAPAHAQDDDVLPLATGFTPDPVRMSGEGGGSRTLRALGASCDGFVGDAPTEVLELQTDFAFLRVFAVSRANITLALRSPDGTWRCSGDRIGSAVMEEGAFAPGRLEIWVAGPERGEPVGYDMSVTEFRSVGPSVGGEAGEIDIGLTLDAEDGRFRGRRLRRGFLPDPRQDDGLSGGAIDVRSLGPECRGYVGALPSHVLTLRNDFDYLRVQIAGAEGVTLVLRTPGGRYLCSSPDERPPSLDQDAWAEGDYQIWVGSRDRSTRQPYFVCYTEARPAEDRRLLCGAGATPRSEEELRRDEAASSRGESRPAEDEED